MDARVAAEIDAEIDAGVAAEVDVDVAAELQDTPICRGEILS